MIKQIKKRFIITCMTAVGILMLVLLGILNIANHIYTNRQTDTKLSLLLSFAENSFAPFPGTEIIVEGELQPEVIPPEIDDENAPADEAGDSDNTEDTGSGNQNQQPGGKGNQYHKQNGNGQRRFLEPELDDNYRFSSVWFSVIFDSEGNVINNNLSQISTLTEEDAEEIAIRCYSAGESSGKTGNYKYLASTNEETGMTYLVFMDISEHTYSVFRVAVLSLLAAILVWELMLIIVVLISSRAIKPIEENYNKQKQFITDAGHELKTPLAVILSNTEAMEMINGENKWTKNIRTQVDRLSNLMQNMLTIAKADESDKNFSVQKFDFSYLVKTEAQNFEEGAVNKCVKIETDIADEIEYSGDCEQIRRLVSILIDNAVKYCSNDSVISISLKKNEKHTVLNVLNSCDSLPDCEPEKLFDRFFRPDSSRARNTGGNGIGLSAAKSIAEHHKGKITAHYKENNQIEFTVTL